MSKADDLQSVVERNVHELDRRRFLYQSIYQLMNLNIIKFVDEESTKPVPLVDEPSGQVIAQTNLKVATDSIQDKINSIGGTHTGDYSIVALAEQNGIEIIVESGLDYSEVIEELMTYDEKSPLSRKLTGNILKAHLKKRIDRANVDAKARKA